MLHHFQLTIFSNLPKSTNMLRTICPHILFWGADLKNTQKIIWELTIISLLSWWGLILVHFSSLDTHIFVIRKEEQNQDVIWEKNHYHLEYQLNTNTALLSSWELYSTSPLQAFADHCSPSGFGHLKGTINPTKMSKRHSVSQCSTHKIRHPLRWWRLH